MYNVLLNLTFPVVIFLFLLVPVMAFDDEQPSAVFVVNEVSDTLDVTPGDGICSDFQGSCTLRAAIMEANFSVASDTVTFASDLALSITLTRGSLSITNPITISGPGARNLTIQRATAANTSLFRLFDVASPTTIQGLTLKNGNAPTGGAIRAAANLVVSDMAITGNRANAGAAIYLVDQPFITFSVIEQSLINGNVATGQGGAVFASPESVVIIRSSTLTGNSAMNGGAVVNNGWTILTNNTIVGNSARFSSQLVNAPGSRFELINNIVGLDVGRSSGALSGRFVSFGGNIITWSAGSSGWNTNDLLDIDPQLGVLTNNGGPTDSISPLPGSPAIDSGNNCVLMLQGCDGLFEYSVRLDQRGFRRAVGRVDIGSIEINSAPAPDKLKPFAVKPPSR